MADSRILKKLQTIKTQNKMTKISKFLNRKPNGEKTLLFVSI
jgi:hypothetical protein